ncbi:MAG: cupin domain-containing protein [Myxococcaceae bacterium]
MRPHWLLLCLVPLVALATGGGLPAGMIRVPAEKIVWVDGTPPFPPTVKVAVLEGDPSSNGFFTVRVKFPAGAVLPMHVHPVDERSTVLSGTVYVGTSAPVEKSNGIKLEAGSFYLNKKDEPHWFMAETEVVLQISTNGPWAVKKLP